MRITRLNVLNWFTLNILIKCIECEDADSSISYIHLKLSKKIAVSNVCEMSSSNITLQKLFYEVI